MKKCILLFHLIICMIAINSNAASKSIEKEFLENQGFKFNQLEEPIRASFSSCNITCYGSNDGSITFSNPTGATNYEYSITGGSVWQSSPSFTNLSPQS